MNNILTSITDSQPMVGEKQGIASTLTEEYVNNPMKGFLNGIQILDSKYIAMRRVRKDGNCFYRGFLYRYLEALVSAQLEFTKHHTTSTEYSTTTNSEYRVPELIRIRTIVEESKSKLLSVGYEASAMDMFWEMFLELLDEVPTLDLQTLHTKMNDEKGISPHVVWFCRALSATQIKINVDRFAPFIMDEFGNVDVDQFCRTQVEPVNHECEQVQIIALTEMLQIPVAIEYLDASGATSCLVFPESAQPTVKLLYRPGHYDILYDQ